MRAEVAGLRIQPRVQVGRLDRDDAAVMAGRGHLGRRIVGDRGKGQEFLAVGAAPVRPQAGYQHHPGVAWAELEHRVALGLAFGKLAAFAAVHGHVLVEGLHRHHAMREAEQVLPVALQIVAARVVGAGILAVPCGGLARGTTLVTHRAQHAAALLPHHHRGEMPGIDA